MFNTCLVYVEQGTITLGGNEQYTTQLFSENFRSLRFRVSVEAPRPELCSAPEPVTCGTIGRGAGTLPNGPPITVAGAMNCDAEQQLSIKGWNLSLGSPWTVYKLKFFDKDDVIPASGAGAADPVAGCYELVVDPADLANSPLEVFDDPTGVFANEDIVQINLANKSDFISDLFTACSPGGGVPAEVYPVLVSPVSALTSGEPVCYSDATEWLVTVADGATSCEIVDPTP